MTVIRFIDAIQYDDEVEIEVRHGKYKYATSYYDDLVDGYALKCEDEYEGLHDAILMLQVKNVIVSPVVLRNGTPSPIILIVEV